MSKVNIALFLGIILSIVLRLFFILNGSEVADIHALKEMAEVASRGINPYLAINYNIYPPLAIFIEEAVLRFSQATGIPFFIATKILPNLADLLIGLLIFRFLVARKTKPAYACLWALIYFLNPVSIIISAAHGQIDSIPTLLVISAILVLLKLSKKTIFLGAMFLGLSVAIKPNPLILLPFFCIYIYKKNNFRTVLLFLFLTVIPVSIFLWPYVMDYPQQVLPRILSYTGSNDFGIPALLRGWEYVRFGHNEIYPSLRLIQLSKWVFLVGLMGLLFFYRNCQQIMKMCLLSYLLFFAIYFGISAQYLSWILPLAILLKNKIVIPYSVAATLALLGYYLFFNPKILLSQFTAVPIYQGQYMWLYVLGNFTLWVILLIWLIKSLGSKTLPKLFN